MTLRPYSDRETRNNGDALWFHPILPRRHRSGDAMLTHMVEVAADHETSGLGEALFRAMSDGDDLLLASMRRGSLGFPMRTPQREAGA